MIIIGAYTTVGHCQGDRILSRINANDNNSYWIAISNISAGAAYSRTNHCFFVGVNI